MVNKHLPIFIDTSFFKALVDQKDEFYDQALKINTALIKDNTMLVTTNYILDETFTLIRKRCGLAKALKLRENIANHSMTIHVVRVTTIHDAEAWTWFQNDWSGLSFTDCVSFVVMQQRNITSVATFDKHFTRAGFTIVEPASR